MTTTARDLVHGNASELSGAQGLSALNNKFNLAGAPDFANDLEVLNYALTLEYLEAAFYKQGNEANLLSGVEKEYLATIESDEATHVSALTDTIKSLGGSPVAAPGVDFGESFASRDSYLKTSHVFENLGTSAYLGAAGFIKDKGILQAAASIFGVEARHAAVVGNLLGLKAEGGVYMGAFETPKDKATVLAAATPFIKGGQMGSMPNGGVQTGGGSTAGGPSTGAIVGGIALLGAAGAAAVAARRYAHDDAT
ncbi:ferritin-like domain-containing protein [Nakamurella sp. A5-74]|uniref:Ferritin-like domain-containing protein n=1 Tax=Nakamurella sp. A5-74 TaxID=3158264 RepID=A0AAU8DPJ9_9ACTN